MKAKINKVLIALALILPVIGMACEAIIPKLQQGVDTAKQISLEAQKTEADIQKQVDALPVGDVVRVALEAKLVKVKEIHASADKYIGTAQASITALQTGVISPELATTLGTVPYGNYVVGGAGLILALISRLKATGAVNDLSKLAEAYKTVGPELSAEDKTKAADILGPKLTAQVHPELSPPISA